MMLTLRNAMVFCFLFWCVTFSLILGIASLGGCRG